MRIHQEGIPSGVKRVEGLALYQTTIRTPVGGVLDGPGRKG